jgi:nitronate monooxygenase
LALRTALTKRLGIAHPIIQAPMAGGATTAQLVAAVCDAGAFGSIAAAYLTPDSIRELSAAVRARTSRSFGINVFAPLDPPRLPADIGRAIERVAVFHKELGLPPPTRPRAVGDPFAAALPAVLDSGASVFSFTFGTLPGDAIEAVKRQGMFLIGTATTVEEAVALENLGVDAVVAQGSEAGAHRGTFAVNFEEAMIGVMALVPPMVDAVRIPVIAAGGIMDGRGIAAALALGASAVQMGTAFLTCDEAGVPDLHKAAILSAHEHQTRVTRAFTGRPARGIANRFMSEIDSAAEKGILPFPLQNDLTRSMRKAAVEQGRPELLALWAGQGVRLARRQSAATLIARLVKETEEVFVKTSGMRTDGGG